MGQIDGPYARRHEIVAETRTCIAPWFSWASVDAPVTYDEIHKSTKRNTSQAEGRHIEYAGPSCLGQVASGILVLRGPVSAMVV